MIYEEEENEQIIAGEFKLIDKISQGGFGDVYVCESIKTQKKYAIKIEICEKRNPKVNSHLNREYRIHKIMQGATGFPKIHCFYTKLPPKSNNYYFSFSRKTTSYLVHELLGPSLDNLFFQCNHRFSLKTVLMIADQALCRLEYMHNKNFIHQDVKPDNFLIGTRNNSNILYLIDFGLSKNINEHKETIRDPMFNDPEFIGTSRYATISAHLGNEQTPKDDLESLSYSFVYFLKGKLPWQGVNVSDKQLKNHIISQKKQSIPHSKVFEGLPTEFYEFFLAVHNLPQNERPNYSLYREMFRKLMLKNGYVYDYQYDWIALNKKKIEIEQKKIENKNADFVKIHPETDFNRNLKNSSKRICYENEKITELNDEVIENAIQIENCHHFIISYSSPIKKFLKNIKPIKNDQFFPFWMIDNKRIKQQK